MFQLVVQIALTLYVIGIIVTWAIAGYNYGQDNQRSRNLAKAIPGTNPHGMQANPYMIAVVGLIWPAYYGIMKGQQSIKDELDAKSKELTAKRQALATSKVPPVPTRGSGVEFPPARRTTVTILPQDKEGKPQ